MNPVRLNVDPPVQTGKRLPVVDEIKGLALVLVLIYHGGGVLQLPNYLHGEIGVDLFLIVSGFTLAISSASISLGEFFKRRFLRIFPAYWLALGIFLWANHKLFGSNYSSANIWLHVVGLHAFSKPEYFSAITDSFWFISLIVPAYVVFGFLRRHLSNVSLLAATCGLLTVATFIFYMKTVHSGGLIQLCVRIPCFFIGILIGRLLAAGSLEIRFNLLLGLGLLCFYYITFLAGGITFAHPVPALGIILTWVALRPFVARMAPGRWLLATISWLGMLSYEIYLFHQPLIREYNLFAQRVWLGIAEPSRIQLTLGMGAALVITVVISMIVHIATSHLFSRWRRRPASGTPE